MCCRTPHFCKVTWDSFHTFPGSNHLTNHEMFKHQASYREVPVDNHDNAAKWSSPDDGSPIVHGTFCKKNNALLSRFPTPLRNKVCISWEITLCEGNKRIDMDWYNPTQISIVGCPSTVPEDQWWSFYPCRLVVLHSVGLFTKCSDFMTPSAWILWQGRTTSFFWT